MKFNTKKKPVAMGILSEIDPMQMARPKKTDANAEPGAVGNDTAGAPTKKVAPEFKPSGFALKETIKLFEEIFDNMKNRKVLKQHAGILLAGDPGIGKTTRIKLLSKIMGVNLITIEVPQLIEEHIINIPFLVYNPATDKQTTGNTEFDTYKVVLGDSNLFSQLKNPSIVSDEQHVKNIYKERKDVIALYEALGGSEDGPLIPEISTLRQRFKNILFLDEFYRQTSENIQNILRTILNNKIGSHQLPRDVYVIYATNLNDDGLAPIAKNHDFSKIELKAPSKKEWFSWLVYKFEGDKHITLNKALINKFYDELKSEHLTYEDGANAVYTSPRRWEQLLLYINNAIPKIKTHEDAVDLLSNVKINFRNYKEGTQSDITDKVLAATADLIQDIAGIEIHPNASNSDDEWRKTLAHQIKQKMDLGDARTYVPVISGLPGVGKTARAEQIARDQNLRFIDIEVQNINPEDAIGLPIPKEKVKGESYETEFSIPSLYHQIISRMKELDKEYLEDLKKELPKKEDYDAAVEAYKNQKFKYLIFFDELNRNKPKVFNAIRRVLLEKSFGPSGNGKGAELKLPSDALVMGALNPADVGAQPLTKHIRDVLDIIDAGAKWKDQVDYMEEVNLNDSETPGDNVEDSTKSMCLSIVKEFAERFKTKDPKIPVAAREFNLDFGGGSIYVSAREYTSVYTNMCRGVDRQLKRINKMDLTEMDQSEIDDLVLDIKDAIFRYGFEHGVSFAFNKTEEGISEDEFMRDVKKWILHDMDVDVSGMFAKKAFDTKKASLPDIIGDYLEGTIQGAHQNMDFINYLDNVADTADLRESVHDVMFSRLSKDGGKDIPKYVDEKHSIVRLAKDGKRYTKEMRDNNVKPNDVIIDPSKKVSLIENFFRELLFATRINKIDHALIETFTKAFYSAGKETRAQIQANNPKLANELTTILMELDDKLDVPEHLKDEEFE